LKCNDGICYEPKTFNGEEANCNMNDTQLIKVGYWESTYPSETFWK